VLLENARRFVSDQPIFTFHQNSGPFRGHDQKEVRAPPRLPTARPAGKGKGSGKSSGKGKGTSETIPPPRMTSTHFCKHCGKKNHVDSNCWLNFPEKAPQWFQKKQKEKKTTKRDTGNSPEPQEIRNVEKDHVHYVPDTSSKKRKMDSRSVQTAPCCFQTRAQLGKPHTTNHNFLTVTVGGRKLDALVDTGAQMNFIDRRLIGSAKTSTSVYEPVLMEDASGNVKWSTETVEMELTLGEETIKLVAYIMENPTENNLSYPLIGMTFLHSPEVGGIIMWPKPKLIYKGVEYPMHDIEHWEARVKNVRTPKMMFKTESYSLTKEHREKAFEELQLPREKIQVDLFANQRNHQEEFFCTRKTNAFSFDWSEICGVNQILWANPPWTQLSKVLAKILINPCRIVVVLPKWKKEKWFELFEKLAKQKYEIPAGIALYHSDSSEKPLPGPHWDTCIFYIDNTTQTSLNANLKNQISQSDLNRVSALCRGWGRDALESDKTFHQSQTQTTDQQTDSTTLRTENKTDACTQTEKPSPQKLYFETDSKEETQKQEVPAPIIFYSNADVKREANDLEVLASELLNEVDTTFTSDFTSLTFDEEKHQRMYKLRNPEEKRAQPKSKFTINKKDLREAVTALNQRISSVETAITQSKAEYFKDTLLENLTGEFEKDMKRFSKNPVLTKHL
jgi:predicted aspartyl protease